PRDGCVRSGAYSRPIDGNISGSDARAGEDAELGGDGVRGDELMTIPGITLHGPLKDNEIADFEGGLLSGIGRTRRLCTAAVRHWRIRRRVHLEGLAVLPRNWGSGGGEACGKLAGGFGTIPLRAERIVTQPALSNRLERIVARDAHGVAGHTADSGVRGI